MRTVTWTENVPWDEMVQHAQQEEVLLVRDGHAVALLIPFDDDDLQWYARERDPAFVKSIAEARGQVERGSTVSHRDLKKDLGIDS
jgi:hypothetical protein